MSDTDKEEGQNDDGRVIISLAELEGLDGQPLASESSYPYQEEAEEEDEELEIGQGVALGNDLL
jgi:hypothetical protein